MHGNQKYKYSIIARRKCWNINTNQSLSLKKKKLYIDYSLFKVKWAGRAILMDHLGSGRAMLIDHMGSPSFV